MRPGPPVQPSHRRPPRRQHPHQQQLHQERDRQRQRQHRLYLPQQPRANGGSPRALLVLLLLASSPLVLVQAEKKQNLTIGYLTAIKGGLKDRQGLAISGALSMALDEVSGPRGSSIRSGKEIVGCPYSLICALNEMFSVDVFFFFGIFHFPGKCVHIFCVQRVSKDQ